MSSFQRGRRGKTEQVLEALIHVQRGGFSVVTSQVAPEAARPICREGDSEDG